MIVTTGTMIKVECGFEESFTLYKDSNKPGVVVLRKTRPQNDEPSYINLPGNPIDAQYLIDAYLRILREPIEYKTSTVECISDGKPKNPDLIPPLGGEWS